MRTRLFVAIALFAACKGKDQDKGKEEAKEPAPKATIEPAVKKQDPPKPKGTPRPQPKLTVTDNGKPLEMATALAYKAWDGTIRVTASTVPVSCEDVTGDMRTIYDGETTFDISFASSLQPDGSMKPELRSTYFGGMTAQKTMAAAATGDATPGQPTTLDVDFEIEDVKGTHKLVVKGTIDALGCEVKPRGDAPALPPEMPAKITVAGKAFPIRFAKFSKSGDWPSVELFTGAAGCKQVPFAPPSEVTLRLTWFKPETGEVSQADLGGALVRQSVDQTFDKKKLKVKPVPTGAGEIEVAADIKVMDFPVKLEGKVTVTECPK
ncbi:MAG: hypothetical protein SFX73_00450 [Kofleriaceae bacterium]|nr:hypothetical protein [Kofleriaceae bacterium]